MPQLMIWKLEEVQENSFSMFCPSLCKNVSLICHMRIVFSAKQPFMHRVMATEFADRENPASKMVELLTVDCLAELSPTLTAEIPFFNGSELVFLDVPEVRDVINYPTYNRQFASQAKF